MSEWRREAYQTVSATGDTLDATSMRRTSRAVGNDDGATVGSVGVSSVAVRRV